MAYRIIPAVVDPDATFDPEKRHWKLALFNADGSPFTGTEQDTFVAGLSAQIAALEARVAALEDVEAQAMLMDEALGNTLESLLAT